MMKLYFVLFICCVALTFGEGTYLSYPQNSCAPNEEMQCVRSCPPEGTCRNRFIGVSCLAVYEPCGPKCVCKEGYYRNFLGTCITNEECEQCPGKNEFFACDSACDNECSTINKQNRTSCPIKNITCNRKCYCDDGYARDASNNCIPAEKCGSA